MEHSDQKIKKPARRSTTQFLVAWIILMYIMQVAVEQIVGKGLFTNVFAKWNEAIVAGQWWRLLTYAFVHGALIHFVMNAASLFLLGTLMERRMNGKLILLIFFAGVFEGGYASFKFSPYLLIGASPGIFALCGAWLIFMLKYGRTEEKIIWIAAVLIDIGLSFIPQFDLSAHLGGLAIGLALGILFFRSPKNISQPVQVPNN